MENLAIVGAQVASSKMDGGSRIVFTSTHNLALNDYVTVDYGKEKPLKFRVDIISVQQEPPVYLMTATFKGSSYEERHLDVRSLLGLIVNLVDEETNKKYKNSEGLI